LNFFWTRFVQKTERVAERVEKDWFIFGRFLMLGVPGVHRAAKIASNCIHVRAARTSNSLKTKLTKLGKKPHPAEGEIGNSRNQPKLEHAAKRETGIAKCRWFWSFRSAWSFPFESHSAQLNGRGAKSAPKAVQKTHKHAPPRTPRQILAADQSSRGAEMLRIDSICRGVWGGVCFCVF